MSKRERVRGKRERDEGAEPGAGDGNGRTDEAKRGRDSSRIKGDADERVKNEFFQNYTERTYNALLKDTRGMVPSRPVALGVALVLVFVVCLVVNEVARLDQCVVGQGTRGVYAKGVGFGRRKNEDGTCLWIPAYKLLMGDGGAGGGPEGKTRTYVGQSGGNVDKRAANNQKERDGTAVQWDQADVFVVLKGDIPTVILTVVEQALMPLIQMLCGTERNLNCSPCGEVCLDAQSLECDMKSCSLSEFRDLVREFMVELREKPLTADLLAYLEQREVQDAGYVVRETVHGYPQVVPSAIIGLQADKDADGNRIPRVAGLIGTEPAHEKDATPKGQSPQPGGVDYGLSGAKIHDTHSYWWTWLVVPMLSCVRSSNSFRQQLTTKQMYANWGETRQRVMNTGAVVIGVLGNPGPSRTKEGGWLDKIGTVVVVEKKTDQGATDFALEMGLIDPGAIKYKDSIMSMWIFTLNARWLRNLLRFAVLEKKLAEAGNRGNRQLFDKAAQEWNTRVWKYNEMDSLWKDVKNRWSSDRKGQQKDQPNCSYSPCAKPLINGKSVRIKSNTEAGPYHRDWSGLDGMQLCISCYQRFLKFGTLDRTKTRRGPVKASCW
mmetsp:Transcript_44895/g.108285  ORF Transcript_44895/g.108285 Transcript_44895/m.108285 type:complete len:605 (+) Transcript_44895:788-2602(+)